MFYKIYLAKFWRAVLIFKRLGMKKYVIKISLAIFIVAVVLLILLWLRTSDRDGTAPSYRFLGGRSPIKYEKSKTGIAEKRYIYSFEADFNDICLNMDVELNGENFVCRNVVGKDLSGNEHSIRDYWIPNRFPRGQVWIVIHNNLQYIELQNSKKDALCEKDGWNVIDIAYGRGWQWPF
jgi:hypothetical protein